MLLARSARRQGEVSATGTEVLTVGEIAASLKISEATVYGLVREGEIPAFRVGRSWRIEAKDFNDYIRRQKARPVTELDENKS
jgi:putative molybdopterin biosynthesis protein